MGMKWKWGKRIPATANLPFSSLQWQAISLTVIEKVQIAAAILGSLFLIASISWLIWSTFSPSAKWQRQDLLFQICYGMYGFMDVVCIGGSGGLSLWEVESYMVVVRQISQDSSLLEAKTPGLRPVSSGGASILDLRGKWDEGGSRPEKEDLNLSRVNLFLPS